MNEWAAGSSNDNNPDDGFASRSSLAAIHLSWSFEAIANQRRPENYSSSPQSVASASMFIRQSNYFAWTTYSDLAVPAPTPPGTAGQQNPADGYGAQNRYDYQPTAIPEDDEPNSESVPLQYATKAPRGKQLFVHNLPSDYTEGQLRHLFSEFGQIVTVTINHPGHESAKLTSHGFVVFDVQTEADDALLRLNCHQVSRI